MPSRPMPLIDSQELARRNNESSAAARKPKPRRTKSKLLNKLLEKLPPPTRPIRAVGFFSSDRKVGFHDSIP